MDKSQRILFIKGTPAASGYYRMSQIQQELKRLGFDTDIIMYTEIDPVTLLGYKNTDGSIDAKPKPEDVIDLATFHTVIFQMVFHEALNMVIDKLKQLGIQVVMEIDDDYTCLPESNPSFYSFHPRVKTVKEDDGLVMKMVSKKYKLTAGRHGNPKYVVDRTKNTKVNFTLDNMFRAARNVDFLQVSTPELAESFSRFNKNIFVWENCIDNDIYDALTIPVNDEVVMGWYGTKTHKEDIRLIDGCIPENVQLLITGFQQLEGEMFKYHENIEFCPVFALENLPYIVKKHNFAVVPLVDCKFNAGKSDIKGLEFGAGSVPVITSDVAPYRRWIRHGENGFIVKHNKPKLWIRYMQQLADDPVLRLQLGAEAKKDAVKRDIKNNIHKFIERYSV